MEEEIDLRPYIKALIENWYWIAGSAVVAALLALGISFVLPPTYEAMSLVTVIESNQRVQLDSRIQDLEDKRPLGAYPELAMSGDMLLSLFTVIQSETSEIEDLEKLEAMLEAASGSDPSLIRLKVSAGKPELAAQIANTWADLFVASANEIYGDQSVKQVAVYESQLLQAEIDLETAEKYLIDFQSQNRTDIIDNELESLTQFQSRFLVTYRDATFLLQDVQALQEQLSHRADSNVSFADQLTSLSLELKTFNVVNQTAPLQLHLDSDTVLTTDDPEGLSMLLFELTETLQVRIAAVEDSLAELEPAILVLQTERQEMSSENGRLTRNRDVSEETYLALAHKVAGERITSQDVMNGVRLASQALVPMQSADPSKLIIMTIAGMLGIILSMLVIVIVIWHKQT